MDVLKDRTPGSLALARFIGMGADDVLDIGAGSGRQAATMRASGLTVTTLDIAPPSDIVADFMSWQPSRQWPTIWASHVLEHQPDAGAFLRKCFALLPEGGVFAVTVPPLKHEIVGGHVSLWNAGLLLYQMILAGFDCSQARVGTYSYNVSVIVEKKARPDLQLKFDTGDIETLARYFPLPVTHGFDGRLPDIRW